jgi:hypothetical protein
MPKGKRKDEGQSVAGSIYFIKFDEATNTVHVQWSKLNGQLDDGTFVRTNQTGAVGLIGGRLADDLEDEYVRNAIEKQVEQGVRKALNNSDENRATLTLDRNLFLPSTESKPRGPKAKASAEDVLADAAE